MALAYAKWTQHISNGLVIYQMGIKYTNIFHSGTKIGTFGKLIYHLAIPVYGNLFIEALAVLHKKAELIACAFNVEADGLAS
jgi:hypothetical protein